MANIDNIKAILQQNEALKAQRDLALSINDLTTARARQEEVNLNNQILVNEQNTLTSEIKKGNVKLSDEEKKILGDIEKSQRGINTELTKEQKLRRAMIGTLNEANRQFKIGWQYLMQSDKVIRQTILSLGLSGAKADLMRSSFEQSSGFVARLGGSLEDIQKIMEGYADETGRARVMSAEMVKDITAIGKGTAIGIEQATRLGSQFELMGFDAKTTMEYVQGVVDTSERMGVNTTKVLKVVSDNFKRLNTYTFQQGVRGFAQMAMYAEKFRIDINQALNAADVAKSLEGAIDLAANLQIMGGEFAKTDPFQMLFLSRNDPAKFTEKISEMTKGVVSFRKMADGTFEKFISPADRNRLEAVAKSLGMEASEITEIAERRADLSKMNRELAGLGLTGREKELVEGAAIFNKKSGKFQVELAGQMKDIGTLTKEQANSFVKERVSLEERAKSAQTFEDAFKATIAELKTALLPILQSVNRFLVWIRPMVVKFTDVITRGPSAWAKVIALFFTAGLLWKGITFSLERSLSKYVNKGTFASHVFGGRGNSTIIPPPNVQPVNPPTGGMSNGNVGKGLLRGGAGIGAAALGVGAGIGAAAIGISKLADSMNKLTPEQAETLKSIVKTLGWFVVGGMAAAVGVAAFGAGATAAAPGLLAFGAAVALIGAGIGVAAAGIGFMGTGLSKLVGTSKGAGKDMLAVGAGIGAISMSLMGLSTGVIGLAVFAGLMHTISKNATAMAKVGDAFKQINTVMSGSKQDFIAIQNAVESISKINIRGGSAFSDLANLLKSPLKVEFADKRISLVSDITLNIDGQKFMQKVYNVNTAIQKHEDVRLGKT